MHTPSKNSRAAASLVALIAVAALALQVALPLSKGEGLADVAWSLTRYFTILTNSAVAIILALVAGGRGISPRVLLALASAIAGVGLVYHALLRQLNPQEGLGLLADHGVHTFVPLLTVLWFITFVPRSRLRWKDAVAAVIWPLAYCAYAMARGAMDGIYPYPFVDLNQIDFGQFAINATGLSLFFIVLALTLLGLLELKTRIST